ncbi:hypothetical protein EDI_149070 [Entamoeba dispar SAW760]|uniref:DWNN domain-containing protein n=1 Tax=Entamoeba dispar (strain ATCC PRA-260 / SAW760) TaxID=370354 RepID=B0EDT8_ENTDS|nr:uncharacterized protein EDI_149070 [Entamoeba dispar SAW760]EDR27299.1 hypothetical protein EDI_149070 [Entamoeba dispar SAW760]|eukprot:EDR27299.1 hypothetical protein EDI_149070 [Entamoeba dispar SAW760]
MATRSVVMYHFEISKKVNKRIQFYGKSITASEVIGEILKQRKDSFDRDELHIFDVQTGHEYVGSDPITKNTYLCVKRLPRSARQMVMKKIRKIDSSIKPTKPLPITLEQPIVLTEEQIAKKKAEEEKKKIGNEKNSLLCECGNLLKGAVICLNCGDTICEKCLEKGVCPSCNEEVNEDNTSPKQEVRDCVEEFIKKYPDFVEN